MTCRRCRWVRSVTVFPYHCQCGIVYHNEESLAPRRTAANTPKTAGRILRELIGCSCNDLPWKQWDANGNQWCIDHADEIAQAIADEPKTGMSFDAAKERVDLAIRIAQKKASNV